MKWKPGMKKLNMVYQMLFLKNRIGCSTVKMTVLLKNKILEKVQQSEGLTDKELLSALSKNDVIPEGEFNKILLDLEIKGLISVSWQTKNIKRIEYVTVNSTDDEYDKQIKETEDRDYEASFPNTD